MLFPFRLIRRLVTLVVLLVVLYGGFTFIQVWSATRTDDRSPSGAIVVLGAAQYDGEPSPVLKARLDHTLELWHAEVAPLIFVTGGKQPGDRLNEAAASANYLMANGVPEPAILREVDGRNTWQSLASASNELRSRDVDEVVLVSDPFHNARVEGIAEELGLNAHVSPTRTSPISGRSQLGYLAKETVAVGVGRIIGFRRMMGIDSVADRVRQEVDNK